MKRIVVTGMGAVSCIGNDVKENLQSLRNGKCGIGKTRYFESKFANTHCFGEVKLSNNDLFELLKISNKTGITRTDLLAHKAFLEAIVDAKLTQEELSSFDTAFISASTVGGMCNTDQLYSDAMTSNEVSEYAASYSASAHTFYLSKKYKIRGITDTLNTACSSSANAIMLGARLLKSGRIKRAIVGGVDSLAKYTVNGFNSLGILSPTPTKPFDKDRIGLSLGEASAYLVLEALDDVDDKTAYAEIGGYGNAGDAFHTSSISDDADGIVFAIRDALKSANIDPEQIDYVNTHGTGTGNNDLAEIIGFQKIFKSTPPFNSTKSYTGHTLGAAGSLEAVFTILSIINGEIYPSLNFESCIEGTSIAPVTSFQRNQEIKHALSNSYGFSGSCTSLVLSKI